MRRKCQPLGDDTLSPGAAFWKSRVASDRLIGIGQPVLPRYEPIAFEKALVAPQGQPLAAFVCPGHPLLDSVLDLTLERNADLLKRGSSNSIIAERRQIQFM
jgi:hypothetical protein